jgi:hypothetical protein
MVENNFSREDNHDYSKSKSTKDRYLFDVHAELGILMTYEGHDLEMPTKERRRKKSSE